jgi:hypothetical protein
MWTFPFFQPDADNVLSIERLAVTVVSANTLDFIRGKP